MSGLASVADVKRILRIPASSVDAARDARISAGLEAIEAWAINRIEVGKEGPQVEVYRDIREDATLHLPASDVVVTAVRVFEASDDALLTPADLSGGQGYELDDEGRLILRPVLNYSPFEGALAQRSARWYKRVEVHYIGSGVVPKDVTEGIAFLAAGYYEHGPKILSGLTSEKIGDYSYTIGGGSGGSGDEDMPFLGQAMFFLRDHVKKSRVAVV